jgi:signal peptide peptidase SppA
MMSDPLAILPADSPAVDFSTLSLMQALAAVPALHQVAHLDDYFGVWCVEPGRFTAMAGAVSGMDLQGHIREKHKQAAADAEEGAALRSVANGYGYRVTEQGVAIVAVDGVLMRFESSMDQSTSTVMLRRTLRSMARDSLVKSAVLVFNSPGGTASGTDETAQDVADLAAVKPVVAYAESLMASAAYYIASQATRVVAHQSALVGSIGTYATLYDLSGMMAQKGIKVHVVKAGAHKAAGAPGTEIKPEDLLEVQRTVDGVNALFLSAVRRGRPKMNLEAVADGRVFLGREALDLGLVDGVARLDQVLADLASASTQLNPSGSAGGPGRPRGPRSEAGAQNQPHQQETPPMAETSTPGTAAPIIFTPEAKLPPPRPATLQELKLRLSKADAGFLVAQLERSATIDQAVDAWMAQQEAALEAAKAARPGGPGIPAGPAQSAASASGGDDTDPAAAFQAKFEEQIKACKGDRAKAMRQTVHQHPELHAAVIAAANPARGRAHR